MCRRFALRGHHHDAWLRYVPPWKRAPRYNIAPTDSVLCLSQIDHGAYPKFQSLQWGYPLRQDVGRTGHVITISATTLLRRRWSRNMLRDRRCLIPADGFYVWSRGRDRGAGQPHFVHQPDDHPFYFAALWTSHGKNGFCVILTTSGPCGANRPRRIPVILHANYHEPWLDPNSRDVYELDGMLAKGFAPELESYPVGAFVNDAGNEGEDCIRPVGPARRGAAALADARTVVDRRRANQASPHLTM